MKTTLAASLTVIFAAPALWAQGTGSHRVTVAVMERNSIVVVGGDITMLVSPLNPSPTVDQTCDLLWFANGQGHKRITVHSSLVNPRYELTVEAVNITGSGAQPGTPAGAVPLRGGVTVDFITRIRSSLGACDLRYAATATWAAGTGTDVHTVTYTLADR